MATDDTIFTGMESAFVGTPLSTSSAENDDKNTGVNRRVVSGRVTPYVGPASSKNTTQASPPTKSDGTPATNQSGQKYDSKPSFANETEFITARDNPLSRYSSYTYNITLYMATPEALNNFIQTGQFDINDDNYIVAQSGGINAKEKRAITLSTDLGPNKPGLDYYIDDLELKTAMTGTDGTPTVPVEIRFKVVEPIGFNFFEKLGIVSGKINAISNILKNSNAKPPPLSQNYIIGIRFYGYDADGKLATADEFQYKNTFLKPHMLEPKSSINNYVTYERFFTFQITSASYQLDGRIVTYHIEGGPVAKLVGQGTKFGLIKSVKTIVAGTVKEALQGIGTNSTDNNRSLIQILNEQQVEEKNTKLLKNPTTYKISWGPGTEELQNSKISNDPLFSQENAATSTAANTNESNVRTAQAAQSINTTKKPLGLNRGTPAILIMDQIMAKSDFVTNSLIIKNNQAIETETTKNSPTADIKWYSINPVVKIGGRDPITKDWFYEITYHIEIQSIQYLKSMYKSRVSKWRGAHKRYNFFYTGKNTEIISFEQKYENQFYILQSISTGQSVINEKNTTPVHAQGGSSGVPIVGQPNKGSEPASNTALRINSPADQATANIKIMGDPDYLMTNVTGTNFGVGLPNRAFRNIYGMDPQTMNPYKGQLWIEIIIKGADEYKSDGTLNLIDVDFYKFINNYDNDGNTKRKIDGIIYRIIEITSTFSSGKFQQTLELILVGENELNIDDKDSNTRISASSAGRGGPTADPRLSDPRAGRGGPTAEEISAYNITRRAQRFGTPDELRRNVHVVKKNNNHPNDDQKLQQLTQKLYNKRENQRLLTRPLEGPNAGLLPGGNRNKRPPEDQ